MNFVARRQIIIQSFSAVMSLKVGEVRPEIVSYLKGDNSWLSPSEQSVFESMYLEKYLGLYKNGRSTSEGRRVEEHGKVFIPEHGLYELLVVNNPILGNNIINFKRIKPSKTITEQHTEPFEGYNDYQGNYYTTLDEDHIDFIIYFHFNRSNKVPQVIWNEEIIGKISIESNPMTGTLLSLQYLNNEYLDHNFDKFDLDINLTNLLTEWNSKNKAVEKKYEDLTLDEKDQYHTGYTFNKPLFINNSLDSSSWAISIQNVPILPKTAQDAEKWLEYLLIKSLEKENAYITLDYVDKIQNHILSNTPIFEKHPTLMIHSADFHSNLSNTDHTLYRDIQTAQDLRPESEDQP